MTWITADFPHLTEQVKNKVHAYVTCRNNGASEGKYTSFNLASHVSDNRQHVMVNRALLRDELELPNEPYWLNQTHSVQVLDIPFEYRPGIEADASFTQQRNKVCAVLTADCLPLLLVNDNATEVAAIHAGWRGLQQGIIDRTVTKMLSSPETIHVYLGPAIGPSAFEVGAEVKQAFINRHAEFETCFKDAQSPNKYFADIYSMARLELNRLGVKNISGGNYCTYERDELFYSYRRDGQTGRMASLIWLE